MPEDPSSRTPGIWPEATAKFKNDDTDNVLVAGCIKGDTQAWAALIGRYQGFIISIAVRRGLSRSDAEDVFQNVCVKLYEHLADLRDVRKLSGWIAAVAVREAAQLYRKDAGRLAGETVSLDDNSEAANSAHVSPIEGPEEEILAMERREVVRRMLNELSDECRNLLSMLYVAENPKSYNEVAADLQMPLGSIGPKRARCLARLRSLLERIGYG